MTGVMGSQDSQISSSSQVPPSTPRKRAASPSFTTPAQKLARGNNGTIPRNNFNTPEDKRKRLEGIERALAEKSWSKSDAQHERDVNGHGERGVPRWRADARAQRRPERERIQRGEHQHPLFDARYRRVNVRLRCAVEGRRVHAPCHVSIRAMAAPLFLARQSLVLGMACLDRASVLAP